MIRIPYPSNLGAPWLVSVLVGSHTVIWGMPFVPNFFGGVSPVILTALGSFIHFSTMATTAFGSFQIGLSTAESYLRAAGSPVTVLPWIITVEPRWKWPAWSVHVPDSSKPLIVPPTSRSFHPLLTCTTAPGIVGTEEDFCSTVSTICVLFRKVAVEVTTTVLSPSTVPELLASAATVPRGKPLAAILFV